MLTPAQTKALDGFERICTQREEVILDRQDPERIKKHADEFTPEQMAEWLAEIDWQGGRYEKLLIRLGLTNTLQPIIRNRNGKRII